MNIKKSLSGKYWAIYVSGKVVFQALTKAECEVILKETLQRF